MSQNVIPCCAWNASGIAECVRGFFFSSRRRHTRCSRDWSSDVCSSDLLAQPFEVCHPGRASAILIAVDLFSPQQEENSLPGPLADRMRPRSLEELVGQDDVLGPGRPLRLAIEHDTLSSLILWGPPGSGKTSLARLIAAHTKAQFEPFSAVTSGDPERGLGRYHIKMDVEAMMSLAAFANGDGRVALNALEFAVLHTAPGADGLVHLNKEALATALQKKSLRYDKGGEEHYNVISAFIKSLRDSDPDGALYWLARMLEAGESPRFIARRMVILASEDVGNANPMALVVATAVAQAVELIGLPECRLNLAQGATYLATCPKDNASYAGLQKATADVEEHGNLPVPLHLRNAPTELMRELGYGKGYRYVHEDPGARTEQTHLPEKLGKKKYYRPKGSEDR